jgi:glycine betaine transporter
MADISAPLGEGDSRRGGNGGPRRERRPTARAPRAGLDPWVFGIAAGISTAFVVWGVVDSDGVATVADDVLSWVIETFGWMFVLSTAAFLVFAGVLAFSRLGRVRLGRDDDRPEFRTASWVAMMFSAGMGIGLMFFAVAEPISHLTAPPAGTEQAGTEGAAQQAMALSYFHWALHPWAIYAVVGLALAYFSFRRGLPTLISSAFHPLLGDRIHGPIGKSIDILAIFATLFGSATSLGLGALQINSGLDFLWGVEPADGIAVAIIAVLTAAFVLSAVSGVHRGIQWLSNGNMVLAILLVLFVLVVGPTVFELETLVESIGAYLTTIVPASFRTGAFGDQEWLSSWTIFYWAWWISWAPFVGTFIARISRGRTVREFVVGVLLVPSGVSFIWFAVFGGAAIDLQLSGTADLGAVVGQPEIALFTTLEQFPLSGIASFVVIVLVALFFISGADAASLVMGMLSTRGSLSPPRAVTVMWGVSTGAAAAILLLANGLSALQQAAIIAAAPFTLVMIGLCVSLFKGMATEAAPLVTPEPAPAETDLARHVPAS